MNEYKNYRLAVALINFNAAYKALVTASVELPDYDIGDHYPFYLIDFEKIVPAVSQWCTIHASQLMRDLPDKVDNPACLGCTFFRTGLTNTGECFGKAQVPECTAYPNILFQRNIIEAALPSGNYSSMTEGEIQLLYMRRADNIINKLAK